MRINTKLFGEIDIDRGKVIEFDIGIVGFENLKRFVLLHNSEKEDSSIQWLQSIDEEILALPVISPVAVCEEYRPDISDLLLSSLGEFEEDDLVVLVTLTVPTNIEEMSVNLKAPIVINTREKKGSQFIVDNTEYSVKYKVYDQLRRLKEKAGD